MSRPLRSVLLRAPGPRPQGGFTLTEVVVAAAVVVIFGASLIAALLSTQKLTAAARVMTSARVIVQRNIDTALGVKFTNASIPSILEFTSASGTAFGDYSDTSATPQATDTPLPIHITKIGNTLVSGTLTRIVQEYPTTISHLDVREVTFRIDYTFNGRDYSYFMTTLRARDDQG